MLGMAEEQVVEHHAGQHRANAQDVERHEHDARRLIGIDRKSVV